MHLPSKLKQHVARFCFLWSQIQILVRQEYSNGGRRPDPARQGVKMARTDTKMMIKFSQYLQNIFPLLTNYILYLRNLYLALGHHSLKICPWMKFFLNTEEFAENLAETVYAICLINFQYINWTNKQMNFRIFSINCFWK